MRIPGSSSILARRLAEERARKRRNGRTPMRCQPSSAEEDGRVRRRGSEGKLIYDSRADAEWTALAIANATGERPMYAYVCPRSRHGHLHLTTKTQR